MSMNSHKITIEFPDKTQHQVDTDALIATLPGDTIREKVIRYVEWVLEPEFIRLDKETTTQDWIHVEDRELWQICALRNKLVDVVFLQNLEKDEPEKELISQKLTPFIEWIATRYARMVVAYCERELGRLQKLKENMWQESESRQYNESHFHPLIEWLQHVQKIAAGIPQETIRNSILTECKTLAESYRWIIRYNDDYVGRKARHQDD